MAVKKNDLFGIEKNNKNEWSWRKTTWSSMNLVFPFVCYWILFCINKQKQKFDEIKHHL